MNTRFALAGAVLSIVLAGSATAQATHPSSVCADGTTSATTGRGACTKHGGVDKVATDKAIADAKAAASAKVAAAKTAKASAKTVATLTCKDGSMSRGGRGACSRHGGIGVAASTSTTATAQAPATPAAPPTSKATPSSHRNARSTAVASSKTVGSGAADNTDPTGAVAKCKDGDYSHAVHHQGACSRHGGVAQWM